MSPVLLLLVNPYRKAFGNPSLIQSTILGAVLRDLKHV